MYLISIAWKIPSICTVQVLLTLMQHPSLQTHTYLETILIFQFQCSMVVYQDVKDCSGVC